MPVLSCYTYRDTIVSTNARHGATRRAKRGRGSIPSMVVRLGYAKPGTDIGYAATRRRVAAPRFEAITTRFHALSATLSLTISYAVSYYLLLTISYAIPIHSIDLVLCPSHDDLEEVGKSLWAEGKKKKLPALANFGK
eukprot:2098675-Rhodomonas_salina.1